MEGNLYYRHSRDNYLSIRGPETQERMNHIIQHPNNKNVEYQIFRLEEISIKQVPVTITVRKV